MRAHPGAFRGRRQARARPHRHGRGRGVPLFQFYLNDVADGGETECRYQRRKVEARAGRLISAPAGFTHTHKGHVATRSDKYVATSWILYRRAEDRFK